ncbi:MAG: hypothetical protein ACXVXM_01940 [Nocardioidaceae bacterium]
MAAVAALVLPLLLSPMAGSFVRVQAGNPPGWLTGTVLVLISVLNVRSAGR